MSGSPLSTKMLNTDDVIDMEIPREKTVKRGGLLPRANLMSTRKCRSCFLAEDSELLVGSAGDIQQILRCSRNPTMMIRHAQKFRGNTANTPRNLAAPFRSLPQSLT